MKRSFAVLLILGTLGLATLFCLPGCLVRQFVFIGQHLPRKVVASSARYLPHAVDIPTADGTVSRGWLLNRGARAPLVAVYGGNNMNVGSFLFLAERDKSRSYLLINYRGYGQSEGSPTQAALVADACAQIEWARQQLGSPASVHLLGFSIGSGVAMQVAAQRLARDAQGVGSVVLICPFDSLKSTARHLAGRFLASLIREDDFDSATVAPRITCPLTIIAGRRDTIVLPEQVERLAAACTQSTPRLHWLDAGHNDVFSHPIAHLIEEGLRGAGAPRRSK